MGVSHHPLKQSSFHKISRRTMVLLRRVKSYGCRSSPSEESPQYNTTTTNTNTACVEKNSAVGTNTKRRLVPDPPATLNLHQKIPQDDYCDIPYIVTIQATSSDDISEMRDLTMDVQSTEIYPLTAVLVAKNGFLCGNRVAYLPQLDPLSSMEEDWPSDEEGETAPSNFRICEDVAVSAFNLCGLGDYLVSPIKKENIECDDAAENASSTRDMAVTCSGSSYSNSFALAHSNLRDDDVRDDDGSPVAV